MWQASQVVFGCFWQRYDLTSFLQCPCPCFSYMSKRFKYVRCICTAQATSGGFLPCRLGPRVPSNPLSILCPLGSIRVLPCEYAIKSELDGWKSLCLRRKMEIFAGLYLWVLNRLLEQSRLLDRERLLPSISSTLRSIWPTGGQVSPLTSLSCMFSDMVGE